jgi:neutral ceramidase
VALPGEIFVELGLALKKASPFKHTLIAELANGSVGYVPNREAYPQGNYEIVSARCEAGSGEKLVEVALKLLGQVKLICQLLSTLRRRGSLQPKQSVLRWASSMLP